MDISNSNVIMVDCVNTGDIMFNGGTVFARRIITSGKVEVKAGNLDVVVCSLKGAVSISEGVTGNLTVPKGTLSKVTFKNADNLNVMEGDFGDQCTSDETLFEEGATVTVKNIGSPSEGGGGGGNSTDDSGTSAAGYASSLAMVTTFLV